MFGLHIYVVNHPAVTLALWDGMQVKTTAQLPSLSDQTIISLEELTMFLMAQIVSIKIYMIGH